MNHSSDRSRRIWRDLARAATVLSSALFVSALVGAMSATALPAGTPPTPGQNLSPASGTEATAFTLSLVAPNNACPGDATTAGGGFRWNQYIVSASVDAATLTWNSNGPVLPAGAPAGAIAQPLFSATTGAAQVQRPNLAAGTGQITGITNLSFATNLDPSLGLPAGQYKVGFACSAAGQTERYWQTLITITAAGSGISWTTSASPTTTTTVGGTTTTVSGATTTTTVGGATTTTVSGATTTTTAAPTTTAAGATTTTVAGATTTTLAASLGPVTGSGSGGTGTSGSGGTFGSGGTIPVTGSSSMPVLFWALMSLVFGRMAVLLAKPVKVLPPRAP
ncbi:unannotated protein [freshwater metagenome]|uniref:Unannotated protein n=1 Tax=freshwater metagenome TaxID=449393 RepID=A0A6J6E2A9_9ZZZZ